MSAEAVLAAFQRFVEALNHSRDVAALGAAVADAVRVERHGPGERGAAPVVETFDGVAEVARWFARTPEAVRFSLAGAPAPEPDGDGAGAAWVVEYAIAAGEFHNGGIWFARLAADGRIAFLSHHPFALRDEPPGR
ncbi:MAG TPA: nuclear transport factor 2 family protein [Kofleriaceae bacterium]|nr:nuclear transport factor 2 family protein [Kofleriaceae bacterium]